MIRQWLKLWQKSMKWLRFLIFKFMIFPYYHFCSLFALKCYCMWLRCCVLGGCYYSWYRIWGISYLPCKHCSKKLIQHEMQFDCSKCKVKESSGNYMYISQSLCKYRWYNYYLRYLICYNNLISVLPFQKIICRYKIEVRVVDNFGNAMFLLWEKECAQLIWKSAGESFAYLYFFVKC